MKFLILSLLAINLAFSQGPAQNTKKERKQNLQLKFGNEVSVFSDKAFRKRNGQLFEAVGNVVILHEGETLYGQSASFDLDSGIFKIKGNVRYVAQGLTLYGSEMEFNMKTDYLLMKNSRVVSEAFNIVALKMERFSKNEFKAEDAEFTTCRDCPESWSIYGEKINLTIGEYVTIKNGLIKVNGTGIMIVPYIVLPVKNGRETGLLFPRLSSRFSEGVVFEQPWFWAIDDSRDMTLTPTFWASRGYGADVQYRHIFGEMKWVELNTRMINDNIYLPGKRDRIESGEERFRHISELESHMQWSHNLLQHFRFTEVRDLDMVQDFSIHSDQIVRGTEVGLNTFAEYRNTYFTFTASAEFNRNQLSNDADKFDHAYVQVMPQFELTTIPFELHRSSGDYFNNVNMGVNSTFTNFRQNKQSETGVIRNTHRTTLRPYLDWTYFQLGAFELGSRFEYETQYYDFKGANKGYFLKTANILKTEFSFNLERIYGLAYEEQVPLDHISKEQIEKLKLKKAKKKKDDSNSMIGNLPSFEKTLKDDFIVAKRNAFKHTQNYKLIHHYIFNESRRGLPFFDDAITTSNTNWFDYDDAIRSQETTLGTNDTKTLIPQKNTIELQWNNTLVKKSPKNYSYKTDRQYLKDHFNYSNMGSFKISQGLKLDSGAEDFKDKLTRLHISTGLSVTNWEFSIDEYYFHDNYDNIFSSTLLNTWEYFEFMIKYNLNSFDNTDLETFSIGSQIKPADFLRLSFVQEIDVTANRNTRRIYELDYLPSNNCYILNLNYRTTLVDERVSFNIVLNFGGNSFENMKNGVKLKEKY